MKTVRSLLTLREGGIVFSGIWITAIIAVVLFGGGNATRIAYGEDVLIASMAELPDTMVNINEGPMVELIQAIDRVWEGGTIKITGPFPDRRSLQNVIDGNADFHVPMIINPRLKIAEMPYRYLNENVGDVPFVIYSHKDAKITRQMITDHPTKFRIETLRGHAEFFDFPIQPITTIRQGFLKIEAGRTDAFIFAQTEGDAVVRELHAGYLHRELYDLFAGTFVIPNGERGDRVEKILSACIQQLQQRGELQPIFAKIQHPYQECQPWQMGWKAE